MITLIHEFGHIVGALDHYGGGSCDSTETIEDKYPGKDFDEYCLFGENQENIRSMADLTICSGCRELMHDKIFIIRQGNQEGSEDDDHIQLT